MNEKRFFAALGALSAALAACSTEIAGPEPGDGAGDGAPPGAAGASAVAGNGSGPAGGGPQGSGGMGTGPGPGSAGGSATPGGATGNPSTCAPGIPATTQIPRLLNRQYDAVVRDLLGVTTVGGEGKPPSALLFADFDGPMNAQAWAIYQDVAAKIAADVMSGANRSRFISCDPAATGCLQQTIRTFGRKAFRRPLNDADVARFEKLSQTTPAGTPAEVAETTLMAFLVSPSFLLVPELQPEAEGAAFKLSSHEIAARLSFLLWGSVPDAMLDAAADAGELTTKEQILAQAQRMIGIREKTAPLVAGFHRRYLDMDNDNSHWWKLEHDTAKFPLYTAAAKPVMQAELDAFFEEVAFAGGSFKDIFLSNVGFVNKDTAALYGLDPAAYGTQLSRVELDAAQRPGFLTRLGFLSSFSRFASTSPILRGAYINANLIGVSVPPPPPDALLTPAPPGEYKTERAYVDALTNQGSCAGCHAALINPPGFALENYDSIGKWQTVDPRGGPIDPTATVTFGGNDVRTITSPRQLMEAIAQGPTARRIYAERWVTFTTGRAPNSNDACVVDELDRKLSQDGYTVLNLLADLTQHDSFRLRVREN